MDNLEQVLLLGWELVLLVHQLMELEREAIMDNLELAPVMMLHQELLVTLHRLEPELGCHQGMTTAT